MNATTAIWMLVSLQKHYDLIQAASNNTQLVEILEYSRGCYDGMRDALSAFGYSIDYDKYTKRPIAITKEAK
jgi:hypothetical protein